MKLIQSIIVVLTATIVVNGVEAITGRVVDGSSKVLDSARVWLKSNPSVVDSTGSDGIFNLPLASTSISRQHITAGNSAFRVKNGQPVISLSRPQQVQIRLYTIKGELAAVASDGILPAGESIVPVKKYMRSMTPGHYILSCKSHDLSFESRVLYTDRMCFSDDHASIVNRNHIRTGKKAAEVDTLVVLRMGYAIRKIPMPEVVAKDVGQIQLSMRTYRVATTTTVKSRTIEVVLPSDYDELYKLPVLYLLHGGGEDNTAWRIKGQLIDALNGRDFPQRDKMQAMIIVTPSAASDNGYGNYGKTGDKFYTDLTVDIKNYIESNYKVDTTRNARAISGFSMGAMQTHNLTLFYPYLFGYSCSISGGLNLSNGYSEDKMKEDIASGIIDTAMINSMKLYRLHSNPTDAAYTNGDTPSFERFLTSVGIKHTYDYTSYSIGGHTFSYCNGVFRNYSGMLFKN